VVSYEVAGTVVDMPCVVRDASAGTALFDVDAQVAAGMVPAAFRVLETAPGRCQLVLAVIDYRDNDLGDYREVGISFFVTPADDDTAEAGTYIVHLPVDQEFTCAAGRAIWGFPKTVEDIGLDHHDGRLTATLRMDGALVFRLTIPAAGHDEMAPMPLTSYSTIDGVPHATSFTQGGTGAAIGAGRDDVELVLGDHPVAKDLAALGLPAPATLTTWTEHMQATFEAPRPLSTA
jgi:hypothetical protein